MSGMTETAVESQRSAMAALAVDAMTGQVVRMLRADGIRPILMKGGAVRAWLYTDGTPRRYGDVDLLVGPAEHDRAQNVLVLGGWRPSTYQRPHAYHLRAPIGRAQIPVDLHRTFHRVTAPPEVVWELLSRHTVTLRLGGVNVETLDEPALALVVVLHNTMHAGVPKHDEDLRRALAATPDAGWRTAAGLADRLGCLEAFAASLRSVPAGRELADRLALSETVNPRLRLAVHPSTPPPTADALLIAWETRRRPVEALRRLLVPPPLTMENYYPLARRGRWGLLVAYAIRPARLLRYLPAGMAAAWRAHHD
jgi:Uncharacterised nucleotidyltransferase